jgi:hypothetical protein
MWFRIGMFVLLALLLSALFALAEGDKAPVKPGVPGQTTTHPAPSGDDAFSKLKIP